MSSLSGYNSKKLSTDVGSESYFDSLGIKSSSESNGLGSYLKLNQDNNTLNSTSLLPVKKYSEPLKTSSIGSGSDLSLPPIVTGTKEEQPWYKDNKSLSAYAGLGSTLLQAAALPSQIKAANMNTKTLAANLAQYKVDNAFRAEARNNLNAPIANTTGIA